MDNLLNIDILLIILFIVLCLSIYKSCDSKNRYLTEHFEGSCCMERFRAIQLMNKVLDQVDNNINKVIQLQKTGLKPDTVKKRVNSKIFSFVSSVQDVQSDFNSFKTKYYTHNTGAASKQKALDKIKASSKSASEVKRKVADKKAKSKKKIEKGMKGKADEAKSLKV